MNINTDSVVGPWTQPDTALNHSSHLAVIGTWVSVQATQIGMVAARVLGHHCDPSGGPDHRHLHMTLGSSSCPDIPIALGGSAGPQDAR